MPKSNTIVLPIDLEAENYVLGACLQNTLDRERALPRLTPEMFSDPRNQTIYRAIQTIEDKGLKLTVDVVFKQLNETVGVKVEGSYLADRFVEASGIDIQWYIPKVVQTYKRRLMILKCQEVSSLSADTNKNIEDTIQNLESALYEIQSQENRLHIRSMTEIADDYDGKTFEKWIEDRREQNEKFGEVLSGPPTGFPSLDELLGGLAQTANIILGAGTGQGKTEMLCQIIAKMIVKDIPILFFSMEMNDEECFLRIMGICCSIFHGRILKGSVTKEEVERTFEQTEIIRKRIGKNLHVVDNALMTTNTMRAIIRRFKKQHGVNVVMVDHLGLIQAPRHLNNRYESTSFNSREMKAIANDEKVCMFVAAQVNRDFTKGERPRAPRMSDLRDSGNIEQDANQIVMMHRETDDHGNKTDVTQLNVVKSRQYGKEGRIRLRFNTESQHMEELNSLEDETHKATSSPSYSAKGRFYDRD